jgi:predicted ATPase
LWVANVAAFNGDVCRNLAADFLALAEKQRAKVPLMIGHRVMGTSLLFTGEVTESRAHFDQAIALYDPAEHRPLATRFGQEIRASSLFYRSWALWALGHPEAALADAERSLQDAREIGQAATLMFALNTAGFSHFLCGNYSTTNSLINEVIPLAEQKGTLFWKAFGMMNRGCVLAVTGKAAEAVQMISSGLAAYRSTGATLFMPLYLPYLARAAAELGQIDDIWRRISEAMTAVEKTRERLFEPDMHRLAGEIALMVPEPDAAKAEAHFERAMEVAQAQQAKILGATRGDKHGAALARSGKGAASSRAARSGLWLVHRRLRHARPEGSQGFARLSGLIRAVPSGRRPAGRRPLTAVAPPVPFWQCPRRFATDP